MDDLDLRILGSLAWKPGDPVHMARGILGPGTSRGRWASTATRAGGGRRAVALHDGELDALEPGEVLVSMTTDPSWTALMARAGAIVTESGGILCHAAVVAREFGVPAVVGARGATQRIRTGDLVEVDGTAGEVKLNPS